MNPSGGGEALGASAVKGALADMRILDLCGEPGLFAGRVLGEFGADVIRVEPPGGDGVRRFGPFLERPGRPRTSLYHLHFNANKRGITLDIHQSAGRDLLRNLVSVSDALLETAPPGLMDSLGIGYEALRAVSPGILYVTITPFGQDGPMKSYRGNDLVGAAASGLMWLNGMPDDPPNQPGSEQAYHMASLAAASGLLVALAGRDLNGDKSGHRIDVSIQEAASMATLQTASANAYSWFQRIPARRGLGLAGGRNLFQCADGLWISFIVPPYRWDEFLEWLEDERIESEVRAGEWADPAYRLEHAAVQSRTIEQIAARYTRPELFREGQRRRLLVMPVNTPRELLKDEQLNDRGFFVDVAPSGFAPPLLDGGPAVRTVPPSLGFRRSAPGVGEHNHDVYSGLLGLGDQEIRELREQGII